MSRNLQKKGKTTGKARLKPSKIGHFADWRTAKGLLQIRKNLLPNPAGLGIIRSTYSSDR
jgi:hypothetical protein